GVVDGGYLVQRPDALEGRSGWRVVTSRAPTEAEWRDLEVAYTVCARTSSNAIVLVKDGVALGIGAGQQSRVDAVEIAANKAVGRALGGACTSDAFLPVRDGLDAAAAAGVTAVVQPGGSVRDEEIVAAAEEHGMALVFTGHRHFRHRSATARQRPRGAGPRGPALSCAQPCPRRGHPPSSTSALIQVRIPTHGKGL